MSSYKYTTIHANANELDVLDFIQGQSCRWSENPNVRLYVGEMERMLENPEIMTSILKMARKKYAKGGHVTMPRLTSEMADKYRSLGRYGDDSIAIVGPRLKKLLDMMAEHKGTTNPATGLPEYFSLGGMFNSLGGGLSGLLSGGMGMLGQLPGMIGQFASPLLRMGAGALPMLGQLAGGVLGSRFGPMGSQLGSQFGSMLGGLGGNMMNSFAGQQQPSQYDQYAQSAGQNLGQMAQNMYGGMGMQPAMGQALSNFGQQNFGNQGMGNAFQGAGNALMMNQGPMGAAQNFAMSGGLNPLIERARGMFGGGQQQNPQELENQQGYAQLPFAGA